MGVFLLGLTLANVATQLAAAVVSYIVVETIHKMSKRKQP